MNTCSNFYASLSFPFIRFLIIIQALFWAVNTSAFEAGEHALIGDLAFAKLGLDYPNKIKSLEVNISYSYGQLVALSGDMYKSIEEISLSDPSTMKDVYRNNRKDLKKCVNKEVAAIRTKKDYEGCGDFKLIGKKVRYITLAHDNYSHFAWHNLKKYIKAHEKSLWFAQLAHNKCSKAEWAESKRECKIKQKKNKKIIAKSRYEKKLKSKYRRLPDLFPRRSFTRRYLNKMSKDKMIRLALFSNAFADHFLTDAFAAGHLRIPRSQIDDFVKNYDRKAWKNNSDKREKGSAVSGALTKYLHNLDGAITGIPVTNSLGDKFIVRSDRQLFSELDAIELSGDVESNPRAIQPVLAAAKSLGEVMAVIENGEASYPRKAFKALYHVPFISNNRKNTLASVVQKDIKKHGSIKNVIKTMPTDMQLIFKGMVAIKKKSYKSYFANFVASIPSLMEELRAEVKEDTKNTKLKRRVPRKLLIALRSLR